MQIKEQTRNTEVQINEEEIGKRERDQMLSRVRLFATPWAVAYQAPPLMRFARQEYWSGLPLPSLRTNPREYQIVKTHRKETT